MNDYNKAIAYFDEWLDCYYDIDDFPPDMTPEIASLALVTLKARQRQQEQPNESLTLDELREMDGESVWCTDTDGTYPGLLCYVECVLDDGKDAHIWLLDNEGNVGRYNVRCMIECGAKFYRRKPEQEEM